MLKEVKDKFLKYFEAKGHHIQNNYSLIPENDPTLMFINAGMAPLKKYFLSESIPPCVNMVTCQKCLRVGGKHNDLKDIGYTKRHHTFFEMLGNFSFGGYFKENAINYAWEFLTKELKLDIDRLYVTIHPKDKESMEFWQKLIEKNRIIPLEANEWGMGDVGPWGFCSEIFYDLKEGEGNFENGDRYLEIWNLVFMEYCKDEKTSYDLYKKCIDTGMGLERIVSVLENKKDTYDIDFFCRELNHLNAKKHNAHTKIILDHLRSVSFLINEGITPSANNEGYILRRLIRRMLRSVNVLKLENFLNIAEKILNDWLDIYDLNIKLIIKILESENNIFSRTLKDGLKQFDFLLKDRKYFSSEDIFVLHDRYGLSCDITYDLLQEHNLKGDFDGFEKMIEKQKIKKNINLDFPDTEFLYQDEVTAILLGVYENYLIFDKTVFYAEGGGQIGDTGICYNDNCQIKILDTKKNKSIYFHEYELIKGDLNINDEFKLEIDKERRNRIKCHHSCVHLSQHAIDYLYAETEQMGSYVSDQKFRLDFKWESNEELNLKKIEEYLTFLINKKTDTDIKYMDLSAAKELGAKAFFKYDSIVRVVSIGPSIELCSGTHIRNTKELIGIKILKISTVKSGVKRIEGIAGQAYFDYLKNSQKILEDIYKYLNCTEDNVMNFIKKLKEHNSEIEYKLLKIIEKNNKKIGLILAVLEISVEDLIMKEKLDCVCLIVEKDDKIRIILKTDGQINAKQKIQEISKLINAKGAGGNDKYAQTGGEKINDYEKLLDVF